MNWPFPGLVPGTFGVVLADPPWSFKTFSGKGLAKSPQAHYSCMSLQDIKDMPVDQLAAKDSLLWMWATWPMLREAQAVMAAWGFEYKTGGSWAKRSKTGQKWAFGTGYILRSASEPFLIGVRGKPAYGPDARRIRGLIEAPVREHSRKPDTQYDMLDAMVPNVPRVELFARQSRPGWSVWGNQTDKFQPEETLACSPHPISL